MAAEYKKLKESIIAELIEVGEKEDLFKVVGKKIEYLTVKKSYNFNDPEEQVRLSFYYELIKKYQYPKERIDLEVIVPRREPTDKADIVVYEDDEKKNLTSLWNAKEMAFLKQGHKEVKGAKRTLKGQQRGVMGNNWAIVGQKAASKPK